MSKSREQLEEIRSFLRENRETIKPMFGLIFWQLSDLESKLNPEEFLSQGSTMTLSSAEDEILASFLAHYMQTWRDSKDFNAASRFVASSLEMTADELLQTRQLFLDQTN